MNIGTILTNAATPFADRPAVMHGEVPFATYGELARRAASVGGWLRARGAAPGARVGLFMSNCPEYLEVLFGIWTANLVAVPVNAKLHPKELAFILENCQADFLFLTADLADAIGAGDYVPRHAVVVGTAEYARIVGHEPGPALPAPAPTDIAWLFYTSGTTGRPKGAMLTHRNLFNMTLSFLADMDPIDQFDTVLHPAPLSHGGGLLALGHIVRGAAHVVPESGGFEPAEIVSLVNRFPGTTFFGAPTMVKRLVASPALGDMNVGNLDQIMYGGGPMYVEDLKEALDRIGPKFWQLYGQGESPCTITFLSKRMHVDNADGKLDHRLASVGIARTGVAVRVVDEEDRDVAPGETGEIIAAGDVVMSGYWGNPDATATTLRGGWLHTGDVGMLDADGFLFLKDRVKDMIISGGSNIYPREIEEVLLQHPAILEASVVGRKHDDWGEEVVAFVVRTDHVSEAELDALCVQNIARFKRPKAYRFVESLPKNNYGKILKTELRKQL